MRFVRVLLVVPVRAIAIAGAARTSCLISLKGCPAGTRVSGEM
jgi:hypothetical protein